MTDRCSATWPSACGWLPRPTGSPHVGTGPHGAVQLGVRPPPRRHVRASASRTPTRARNTQESYDAAPRGDALARASTGTRAPRSAARYGAVPPVASAPTSTPTSLARLHEAGAHLRLLLHQRRGRGAPQGVRLQGAGVRRPLPRAHRRAGRGLRGRGPHAGRAVPDARRRDHLRRPGPRRDHLPHRARARLRARPGQRRTRSTPWSTRSTTR